MGTERGSAESRRAAPVSYGDAPSDADAVNGKGVVSSRRSIASCRRTVACLGAALAFACAGSPGDGVGASSSPEREDVVVEPGGVAADPPAPDSRDREVRRAWSVMGTVLEVAVYGPDSTAAVAAARAARRAVDEVDSLMSSYRADSEVSRLADRAGGAPLPISAPTEEVLRAALEWGERSEGAFDITVAPVVDVWGFSREQGAIPGEASLDSAKLLVGRDGLHLGDPPGTARLARPGMRVDLGGIAKGFAVDRALAALAARGVVRAMVDLGGNVGVLGDAPGGGPWPIGIRHPRDGDGVGAILDVPAGGATATSGDYERFFEVDGVRYAHIVDPRTSRPARGVAAVTVLARDGLEADALSTTLYLLGPERGACLLREMPGTAALWFLDDGGYGGPLPARVAGSAAAAFRVPGESSNPSGVRTELGSMRAFERVRCNTEG